MTDPSEYDAFTAAGPPKVDQFGRVEGNACETVLRAADVPAWRVRRDAGVQGHGRLTFRQVREFAGFSASPAVSADPPDAAIDLLTRLPKTKLWRAWVRAWDERPDQSPGSRVLVLAGPGWGTIVAHDGVPPETPHIALPVPAARLVLVVEPIRPWAERVWSVSSPPDTR